MSDERIAKKRGGRPSERDEPKRAAIALRTTPAIKERLFEAAEARGRSITQEVEARIEESFALEAELGGARLKPTLMEIAAQFARAEKMAGAVWNDDPKAYWLARIMLDDWIKRARPTPSNFEEVTTMEAERDKLISWRKSVFPSLLGWHVIGQNALLSFMPDADQFGYVRLPEDEWIPPEDKHTSPEEMKKALGAMEEDLGRANARITELTETIRTKAEPWFQAKKDAQAIFNALQQAD